MSKNKNFIIGEISEYIKERNLKVGSIFKLEGGKNSNSYCIYLANKKFLLKFFPKKELIMRDRLNSELTFLRFLNDIGLKNIPKPIFWNHEKNLIIISWLEGKKIKKITKSHIQELVDFILIIQKKTKSKYFNDIRNASESYFSLNMHFQHIKERINLLMSATKNLNLNKENKLLIKNLNKKLSEEYQIISADYKYEKSLINGNKNESIKIISPSDIGFHNMLINKKNELLFFDFEYAGWDDSHKTISDLIIHPKLYIKKNLFYLLKPLLIKYVSKEMCKIRLEIILKLYRIKWACIIMNNLLTLNEYDDINKIANQSIMKSIIYLEKSNRQIKDYLDFQNIIN